MGSVSVTEAKNNLSAVLARVVAGEDVVIVDRGRPIARLEAISRNYPDPEGRVARLERAGLLAPPQGGSLDRVLTDGPVRLASGASALEALIEERSEGR